MGVISLALQPWYTKHSPVRSVLAAQTNGESTILTTKVAVSALAFMLT
jgi:hypothetical protein